MLDSKAELQTYYEHITQGVIIRSKTRWYEEGEKSSKYFLNLEKKNKFKSCVHKLSVNGREITNSKEILSEIRNYFSHKYQCESNKTAAECEEFLNNVKLPTLSEFNKAYRPNAHLLYIVMHYNGNIIEFYIIIITT